MPLDDFQTSVEVDISAVKYALEHDEEFFINFFLGDELTFAVPEFHKVIFQQMTDLKIQLYACAVPRDHAKTTLAKLAVIWYLLFSKYRFVIYLSNTAGIAQAACKDIITFMESDNFKTVYGGLNFEAGVRREGEGLYQFSVNLTRLDKDGKVVHFTKSIILKAHGAGQQIRGLNINNQRPQLAVVDDLEDNDNIATADLFEKLKNWFYGAFRKALDKFDHKIIHLGNMIANKCMLKEHCESPYWHSMRYGCILSNGEPLWNDAWPIEKLRANFAEYLHAGKIDTWLTEMMNMPIMGGMGLIKPGEIRYAPKPEIEDIEYGFITIDLAISKQAWAHNTALVVHGYIQDHWQIVDYISEKGLDPIQLFDKIVEYSFKWRINVIGIENVAYQAALQPVYEYMSTVQGIEGLEFVGLSAEGRKPERLSAWCAMMKKGEYYIEEGDFIMTEQMLNFNPRNRENDDDLIDSCAYGPQMIDYYLDLIQERYQLVVTEGRFNYEAASL